jgi:hypothetical protein
MGSSASITQRLIMNRLSRRKKGAIFAAMTDLFMNFSLALVWVLFVMPASGTDLVREQVRPEEATDGSKPAAGLTVATARLDGKTGDLIISYKGQDVDLSTFESLHDKSGFPEHFVFRFENLPNFQKLASLALENDSAVSLKLPRKL